MERNYYRFFELQQPLNLIKTNSANHKDYSEVYQRIVTELKLPHSIVERIYSSRYCEHFYTQEAIEGFINKWSM